jgi:hypothetical protein
MKADISRTPTFKKEKGYFKIIPQQGRILSDPDLNEMEDIRVHHDEATLQDIIGKCGTTIENNGFKIVELDPPGFGYKIKAGCYYMDGIRCELYEDINAIDQKDLPSFKDNSALPKQNEEGIHLVYLHLWKDLQTALDDPDIRDPAFGGPDTTSRGKIRCQVKLLKVGNIGDQDKSCFDSFPEWDELVKPSLGTIQARSKPTATSDDFCLLPPQAEYQGTENQLIRLEIHDPGVAGQAGQPGVATFKCAKDNASHVVKLASISGQQLNFVSSIQDNNIFRSGDLIEVTNRHRELWRIPGSLARVASVEVGNNRLTFLADSVKGDEITNENYPPESETKIRKWDLAGPLELLPGDDDFIPFMDGIEFKPKSVGPYKSFQFWNITARTTTRGIIGWPHTNGDGTPDALQPQGIEDHYCRLALLSYSNGVIHVESDCRQLFPSLIDLKMLSYVGGGGQEGEPGKTLPFPLTAGVSIGNTPVSNVKVRFEVKPGNGNLGENNQNQIQSIIELKTDSEGLVRCYWKLDADAKNVSQQVLARMLDDVSNNNNLNPTHLSLLYNASIGQQPSGVSAGLANTGIINLVLTKLDGNSGAGILEYLTTPFHHFLENIASPPAIILGMAGDESRRGRGGGGGGGGGSSSNAVSFMEDHGLYNFDGGSKMFMRFKPESVNVEAFKIRLQVTDAKQFFKKENKRAIDIRWYAIPAVEKDSQPGVFAPIESGVTPTIVFDPPLSVNSPSMLTVKDSKANKNVGEKDSVKVNVTITTKQAAEGPKELEDMPLLETGINTGIFLAKILIDEDRRVMSIESGVGESQVLRFKGPIDTVAVRYTTAVDEDDLSLTVRIGPDT